MNLCRNCRYRDWGIHCFPCSECNHIEHEVKDRWEAKEEVSER
jgi:hypothetical protein